MKKTYFVSLATALLIIMIFFAGGKIFGNDELKTIRIGYIYVGDASNPYTRNFLKAQEAIKEKFGDQVVNIPKYNIPEGDEKVALEELVKEKCDIIFATSYGYGEEVKLAAERYPDIQFCEATCSNANEEPVLDNYHTYMGHIYEGRFTAGIAAGMKLREMLDNGTINEENAVIGYVAAFPYAEVISGYTAFFLGARVHCPEVTMKVMYTNTWSDYSIEREYAEKLIEEGCTIISQHSDTSGPAVACENSNSDKPVYIVSYNQSMMDIAPTTSLTGCKINWEPYMVAAAQAMLEEKEIEDIFSRKINVNGKDAGAGFDEEWIQMLELNKIVAAEGTEEEIQKYIDLFCKGRVTVFKGDYIGVNPYDESDTIDLNEGYIENQYSSAPSFNYVLRDCIEVIE